MGIEAQEGNSVGPYELIARIGMGGMGEVWKARDTRLQRVVAIKFSHERFTDRFSREARAIAALNHPNICTLYDVGPNYLVMEYVDGRPLEGPLPVRTALEYAVQIAHALAHAHRNSIVHRDLKPGNVLVTADCIKVLDFGLAKRVGDAAVAPDGVTRSLNTEIGAVVGTPAYMSPEQARGLPVDHRSDLFSFAALLYELLTGRRAFERPSYFETVSAVLNAEAPRVSDQLKSVPSALDDIISKGLAKNPEQRYDSATALAADLISVQNIAAPAQETARGRRRVRAVAAALAIIIVVGVFYFTRVRGQAHPGTMRSIAVLPLKALSSDSRDKLLELGITDTVISKVSRLEGLTVRPTSAVRKYAAGDVHGLAAGKELQVDAVLEGTLQRAGDTLRVTVNLLRVEDATSLWSNTFDTRTTDVFGIQDEIARQLAGFVHARMNSANATAVDRRDTSNVDALQAYQAALQDFDRRSFTSTGNAIPLFERAIELDPQYARAYAMLARCFAWHALFIDTATASAWVAKAEQAANTAERLNPALAETHLARGQLLFSEHGRWRLDDAIRELQIAVDLNPHIGHTELGSLFAHLGLQEPARKFLETALAIDPLNPGIKSTYVDYLTMVGAHDESLAASRRMFNRNGPVESLLALRQTAIARPLLEKELKSSTAPRVLANQALLLALDGEFTAAERLIPRIQQGRLDRGYHHAAFSVAGMFALQGRAAEAVKWLDIAAKTGMPNYPLFSRDPSLHRIRSDPQFQHFLQDVRRTWEGYRQRYT
jgi:serine/threonine protein kinase/tetratricopeptide (TPR) repeat protein